MSIKKILCTTNIYFGGYRHLVFYYQFNLIFNRANKLWLFKLSLQEKKRKEKKRKEIKLN